MEVILKEDVQTLGRTGEVVKVADGFARNYLFPQKKAVLATEGNRKQFEADKRLQEERRGKEQQEMLLLAERIKALPVVFEKEVGEDEKIFGSITKKQMAQALKQAGIEIDPHKIETRGPMKKIGTYTVDIQLSAEVSAQLQVEIRKK